MSTSPKALDARVATVGNTNIKVVKPQETRILPAERDALLANIRHLQTQLGRLSECASKIYEQVEETTK